MPRVPGVKLKQITMNQQLTLQDIETLPSTKKVRSMSEAYTIAATELPDTGGPIVNKRMHLREETASLVYEFYRVRNKEQKIYVIF